MEPAAVVEFQAQLAQIAGLSATAIGALVARLDVLSKREALAFITDAYPALIDPYLKASGELTAQWYSEQPAAPVRPGVGEFVPVPAPLLPADRLAVSGRWAILQSQPSAALSNSATRAVFDQSRLTVISNVERERVKWARHASANACAFCRLLATRGAVYGSKSKALKAHDACKCLAVPVRTGVYKPPAYVRQWKSDYKAAVRAVGGDPKDIVRYMDKIGRGSEMTAAA